MKPSDRQREKKRDPNSARKKRRAAQFGHSKPAASTETPAASSESRAPKRRSNEARNRNKRPPSNPNREPQTSITEGRERRAYANRDGAPAAESPASGNERQPSNREVREPPASGNGQQRRGRNENRPSRDNARPSATRRDNRQRPSDERGNQTAGDSSRDHDETRSSSSRGVGAPHASDSDATNRTETRSQPSRGVRDEGRGRAPSTDPRAAVRTAGGKQRRSLSMPRAQGRIFADGPRELAEGLVASLRAPAVDEEIADSLTHPLHSYPARLHPATARILIDILGDQSRRGPLVDPFCGSGTVLVEARAAGLRALGTDLNPLATLIAHAKTWTVVARRRREMRETGHAIGGAVLAAGKEARRASAQPMPQRKPAGFDPNARDRRLAAWFSPHVRRELELIAFYLDELRQQDIELADVLTACLSAVLYKVSSRTSDTDDTWVQRDVARGAPTRYFLQRVDLLEAGLADLPSGSPAEIHLLDARKLGEVVKDGTASGIVTSPPYAGTYDYAEHQRLRFDFLALRHREFEAGEIGSRRSFNEAALPAEKAWRRALADILEVMGRALAPGARAAIMMGDSIAGGRAYHALDDVRGALGGDLFIEAWASQERPMLGGLEHRAFGDRPKAEHVILLRKP